MLLAMMAMGASAQSPASVVDKVLAALKGGKAVSARSYSPATDEVNITTPTAVDLQMTNPYSAAQNFKSGYIISKGGTGAGTYTIRFTPKKKSNMKHMLVTVSTSNWLITKAVIVQTDGTKSTITISNYNRNASAPASTFEFDKTQVPQGTEVVDLR